MSEPVNVVPVLAIPSLRGKLGSDHVCRGVWALSDIAHNSDDQTSKFEFHLVKPIDSANGFPVSGQYQGWFLLKTSKSAEVKVEDREINIRFIAVVGEEGHRVEGEGSNRFGKFKVHGSLSEGGALQMYREYHVMVKEPVSLKRKGSSLSPGTLKPNVISSDTRDVAPRARKTNSLGNSFVSGKKGSGKALSSALIIQQADNSARTHRLSQHMVRCGELLKDLVKQPQSLWFAVPVDHVALKISDYPSIVKEPMDFSTIQRNLDTHFYGSPESFAEHVRLVFKNAITYNTARDNPVHIAARELSNRFEDKFRLFMSQLTAQGYGQPAGDGAVMRSSSSAGAPAGAKRVKAKSAMKRNLSYGPGQMGLPLAMDGGLVEMQRKIQDMQNELSSLRAQVKLNEVRVELDQHVKESHNPLTLEEKKALIAQIHKLPSAKMDEVVDIIKSAADVKDEGEEVEISLDDLDTHTLRKLQTFVNSVNLKRSYQSDVSYSKKPKKEGASKPKQIAPKMASKALKSYDSASIVGIPGSEMANDSSDFALFGEDDDALAHHDSDGEEAGDDDAFGDFDLVPNGDSKME